MFWKEIKGLYLCFKDTLSILMLGYRRRRKEKEKKKSKVECTLAGKDRIDTTQNYIRHILLYFWVEEWLWHCLHAPWWWPVFCLGGLPTPNKPDTPTFTGATRAVDSRVVQIPSQQSPPDDSRPKTQTHAYEDPQRMMYFPRWLTLVPPAQRHCSESHGRQD